MGVNYYEKVTQRLGPSTTDFFRLFMVPGMFHCTGGVGVSAVDALTPLVEWVEKGKAPDHLVAVHRSDRRADAGSNLPVDNERKLCPYPQHAVYTGPAGGQNNRANWVERNFTCK